MNCIERVKSMIETTPQEIDMEYSTSPTGNIPPTSKVWPTNSDIVMKNVKLQHREGLPFVLHDVSCVIPCGPAKRTGDAPKATEINKAAEAQRPPPNCGKRPLPA